MTPRAANCGACKHWAISPCWYTLRGDVSGPHCLKGHRPRFYTVQSWGDQAGYRRRCDDFEPKEGR